MCNSCLTTTDNKAPANNHEENPFSERAVHIVSLLRYGVSGSAVLCGDYS